jgi:hypothetical protein
MTGRLLFLCLLIGCGDPYRDELIEALGDEDPRFPPGPVHRPGQPCVACHSPYGGATEFAIGGTLFNKVDSGEPFMLAGYTVRLFDSEGQSRDLVSNACGNFYLRKQDKGDERGWDPAFPLRAELYRPKPEDASKLVQTDVMASRIARDGSCAGCHIGGKSPYSPSVVYITLPSEITLTPPGLNCPSPWLGPDPRIPDPEK